jgi:hypothetical protein
VPELVVAPEDELLVVDSDVPAPVVVEESLEEAFPVVEPLDGFMKE